MTTLQKIVKYLSKRSTAATSWEIANGTNSNHNTVRRILGESLGNAFKKFDARKCKVTGSTVQTYHVI